MDRRRFLKIAGLAGLAVIAPVGLREGSAAPVKYAGPYWIMINAGGGWDPTMTVDPKGGKDGDRTTVNQSYTPDQKGKAGNLIFAPTALVAGKTPVLSCAEFFNAHHSKMTVLNGVDTSTNNHDAGSRTIWSGQLAEGYPSFAALAAALAAEKADIPMAYLSNGGYDNTGGLIPLTRLGGTDSIQRLAYPNVRDPNDPKSETYHTPTTASRIAAAQGARLLALKGKQTLPTPRVSMGSLYLAREGTGGLAALGEVLKGKQQLDYGDIPRFANIPGNDQGDVGDALNLIRQMQASLYAFQAGVAVSANVDIGGFDSHNNNDDRQTSQAMQLLAALDWLYGRLDEMGLGDKTYVLVGSDFGRTPYYNNQDGKDHWNITSVLASGPKIQGDRLIGATDDGFKPKTVNTSTLATDGTGVRIEPKHIHLALRQIAGITGSDVDKLFPLPGEHLPLFG